MIKKEASKHETAVKELNLSKTKTITRLNRKL